MRRWCWGLCGVLILAGSAWLVRSSTLMGGDPWDPATLRNWVEAAGPWGPALYVAVASLMPLFAPYPVGLTWVAGALFGWVHGGLLVAAAGVGSSLVGYGVGRTLGGALFRRNAVLQGSESRIGSLFSKSASTGVGWRSVAFLRVVVPWNLVSYWAGASRLPLRVYLAGTAVALLPVSFGYAYVSAAVVEGERGALALAVPVCLGIVFGPLWLLERHRRAGSSLGT